MIAEDTSSEAPDLKPNLIEVYRRLLAAQESTRQRRNKEVLDWLETQPPAIGDQSVGK